MSSDGLSPPVQRRPKGPGHALGCDYEGEIPRRNDAHDPDGLAQNKAETVIADIVVALTLKRPGLTGGVGPQIGAIEDFALGLGNGLPNFEALGEC